MAFIIIIIILNLYTLVNLENIVDDSNNELAIIYESDALEHENTIDSEKRGVEHLNLNDSQKLIFDNYMAYREWILESYRFLAEKLENNPLDDLYEELEYSNIEMRMAYLDSIGNHENERYFSKDLFREEIELLNLDFNYTFDSTKLHLMSDIAGEWNQETNGYVYNGLVESLKADLSLLMSGEKQLYSGTPSPWTFYINKIGIEEYSYQLFTALIIVFVVAIILEDRKNRSDNIVKLLPKKRSYIINHYNKLAFISIISIFLIVFVVPMIYLGVKYDFSGLNNPIFTYKEGFTSFAGYEHVEDYGYYGLGKFYGIRPPFEGGFFPSSVLSIYPLWKVMSLSLVITILKLIFFTTLGVGIGLSFSSIKSSSFILVITSVFYLISQRFADKFRFNPFSIESSWDVTIGAASYTWFKSVVLLIVSIIIMYIIFYIINERRDYTD